MNTVCITGPPPMGGKEKKDGFGPRGAPEVYYTSRVLNSTFRYVRFVKKLRAEEEEQRRGHILALQNLRDVQANEFFARCDRRSFIKIAAHRVDLCMQAYQDDLEAKRKKLKQILNAEEEFNIRKFTEQAQAGIEAAWQDKVDRVAFLLAKRKKEHEDRYKDTPLSKSAHVLPCIYKLRAKEAEEIQLYQMREKQMRKMAEQEMDQMWYEVAMKEADALAARMEYDVIERARRDAEARKSTEDQVRMQREQRAKDQEKLRQEVLLFKAKLAEDDRKEEEAEQKRQENRREVVQDMKNMIREREETVAKRKAEAQLIADTWDSLAGQGLADEKAKEELRRKKERELDECNQKMCQLKYRIAEIKVDNEPMILEEGRRRVDAVELKRCQNVQKTLKINRETGAAIQQQIRDKEEALKNQYDATDDYNQQIKNQLDQLVKHKEITAAQARKLHQKDILEQIEYNQKLKERALKEAMEERRKCQLATEEYQKEITKMLHRPFYSDHVHPFMRKMASGLQMRQGCPCGPMPDYCSNQTSPVK